ncbi:MAG: glycosyltransferase family 39 protein, partial [Methanobacterium paludis]|nr:glycosyltransferase family 39 protein [Methanobacterium paludis]
PGLPYTLALLMKIFGEFGGLTALRIVQAILQVLSLLLIFFTARNLFNSKVAISAVILDITYISEVWVPNLVLTETFFKFFVLCLVYFSLYALEENKTKYYIAGGLALGLAVLFRPTIALYPALILIMWIIKKVKFKQALKYTIIVLAVFSAVMSPWWIRNCSIFKRFIPFTMAAGNPMDQGTFINYNKKSRATDGLDYSKFRPKDRYVSEIERNELDIAEAKYRLKMLFPKQPLKYIYWYTLGKAHDQISTSFYWREILGIKVSAAAAWYSILVIIGILGIIIYFKDKSRNIYAVLPFTAILYFIIVYLPFCTMSRYFYPAVPYLIIFAAYLIVNIVQKFNLKTLTRKQNSITSTEESQEVLISKN